MKHPPALPLFIILAALLSSCGHPKEIDYDKLAYSQDVFTDPATGRGFTGTAIQKDKSGKTRAVYPFKDGRFHGTVKEWHPNGKPSSETEFQNGERTGRNIEWTEDGKPFRERVYDHDHIVTEKNYPPSK